MGKIQRLQFYFSVALVCLLLLPASVSASSHEGEAPEAMPVLWVSYVTAEPGKSAELGRYMADHGKEIYNGLVADGHAVSWGVAQAINHFPGDDWTHLEWVTFANWAGVDAFVSRFFAGMQSKSPEEMAAEAAQWDELTVHGSHYDEIGRFFHVGGDTTQRPGYIVLGYFGTHDPMGSPGQLAGLYEKWRAPLMDKLVEDGTIIGHGGFMKEIHDPGSSWSVAGYTALPDLAAMDALTAADQAQMASMSEEQRKEWMEAMSSTFDLSGHFDRILVVLHYHAEGMEGGGDEGGGDEGGGEGEE